VEANYRGKGKYYGGKISRVRLNGTFDVDYDDGEKEQGVGEDLFSRIYCFVLFEIESRDYK
jgi:hypothetical protein